MGKKAEVGTPKWMGNKMKSKGLQKLRWYCQMCQKQCRDENGFKCHMTSESHQRQLLLFAEAPGRYLNEFSREFDRDFMQLLRTRFGTKRIHANQVYQEYIKEKHHVHMNATSWVTLNGYVRHLGRSGKAVVEETDKGWYITYIDRDPDTIAAADARAKKARMEKDDAERMMEFLEKQVERAKKAEEPPESVFTELKRENEEEKIHISLQMAPKAEEKPLFKEPILFKKAITPAMVDESGSLSKAFKREKKEDPKTEKRKASALGDIMKEQETLKEKRNRKDYWLTEGVVVKVVTKSLGDKYYKKKGFVKEVVDRYAAYVTMLDTGHTLKLDQAHLETVIPAPGRVVKVVNGAYRGCLAILKELNEKKFCVSIEIDSGHTKGRVVEGVQYEDISKFHVPEKS